MNDFDALTAVRKAAVRAIERTVGHGRDRAVAMVQSMNAEETANLAEVFEALNKPPLGVTVRGIQNGHADRLAKEARDKANTPGDGV